MNRPPSSSSPMAEALNWVSRISSVGVMMVLHTLGGRWLDNRYGTSYWGLIGLAGGLAIGIWQIVLIAGESKRRRPVGRKSMTERTTNDKPNEPKN